MEKNQDLIVIEQLPVIKEQLKRVAEEIDGKVEQAKNLICTEENKQIIKTIRADMRKEFEEFENQRKTVKERILAPYMQFEEVYKECISEKYKIADKELKNKIDNIENEQKKRLEDGAREYFEEYKKSNNIDFIMFEKMNLKITLSDNPTKLKKQIASYIDNVVDDLKLIETQECKEEILIEYKQTLNVSKAIQDVANRHKLLEEEKKKREELREKINKQMSEEADKALGLKKQEEILEKPTVEEKQVEILTLRFTVKATRTKLQELKNFLKQGGYDYE